MNFSSYQSFGISKSVYELSEQVLPGLSPIFADLEKTREINQLRVLKSLQNAAVSESYFGGTSGYGYDDAGRKRLEQAYAFAFGAEAAYVRVQINSGTQILSQCLFALLRPGDKMLSVAGAPYDTLLKTIGHEKQTEDIGSLSDYGINYGQVELTAGGRPDYDEIRLALQPGVKMVYIQKSRGYSARRSLTADDIAAISKIVHQHSPETIVMVDNCYGEFVETTEPCMLGADICAGSLIKNPGGGISPTGAYVAGKADLVKRVAARITAPGLNEEVGPSLGFTRLITQGLYLAPHMVAESLKGSVFAAAFFSAAGYKTYPTADEFRGDIVQTLEFNDPVKLETFCQAVQAASPVDSFVNPQASDMPGYDSKVIMAAGTFVQGATIELSADGPLKAPYLAFLQGGLCFENIRLACMMALESMEKKV